MKRAVSVLLVCVILLGMMSTCFAATRKDPRNNLGKKMPNITISLANGKNFVLNEALKEKKLVLINFWTSWCGWCFKEFPFMEKFYEEYKDQIEIIAVTSEKDDTIAVVKKTAEKNGLTFPMGRAFCKELNNLSDALFVNCWPTTILVDRFGRIVCVHEGALLDVESFVTLCEDFLGDNYTETKVKKN